MMELTVRSPEGKQVEPIKADDLVFGVRPHLAVIHQALLAQLANRRAGSAQHARRAARSPAAPPSCAVRRD